MNRSYPRELHVIINTHTARHLRRVLLGAAWQREPADSLTVATDADQPELRRLLREIARETKTPIRHVQRPFTGTARIAQTRNNGVRALLSDRPHPRSLLVFLDGDMVPAIDTFANYREAARDGEVVIGDRIYVAEAELGEFDEQALREGREPVVGIMERSWGDLRRRQRRATHQRIKLLLPWRRRLKPRVLGANHAVWLETFEGVNGFNEEMEGWGSEDTDLGKRIYLSRGRPVVAVTDVLVYHLYHPPRPQNDEASIASRRIRNEFSTFRCKYGLDNPKSQPPVDVAWLNLE